nr:IS21 family transposase [methane-oxidizing endosymbiont of Gigantopelta aegis]
MDRDSSDQSITQSRHGLSKRKIAKQLGVSRNTVSKYLNMPETEITEILSDTDRTKKLDEYRDYIIQLLQTYPDLSAVKVLRKLKAKVETLSVSDRSVRRYIQALKQEISFKQARYYEPVIDMVPGEQCQVDGGELRGVMINGVETTVYLMVFVLSYSRLMHVSLSNKPINTEMLIKQHDVAFRYFGGMPEECVYDQTKLVVISETFRELNLNQLFSQYATAAGFRIHACEGYDPESKGKVEAGVKYAKNNGLYGESFASWHELEQYFSDWLDNTANQRVHGSTGKKPREYYDQSEQAHMQPYLTPSCIASYSASTVATRKADKTGLIAWQSNKYSVPMAYQSARVGVKTETGQLIISDLETGNKIAEHLISIEKGQVIKNTDHYRDKAQRIKDLEAELLHILGDTEQTQALCALLKTTSPKIYKDQLLGAKQIVSAYCKQYGAIEAEHLSRLINTPRLTATGLRERLLAFQQNPEKNNDSQSQQVTQDQVNQGIVH